MLASLPMYDLPCVRDWTDAWWQGLDKAIRRAGLTGLPAIDRGEDRHAIWRHPDMTLSQICGYAVAQAYRGRLQVVATPCYAVPGCDGPRYRSAFLVAEDHPADTLGDLRDDICACNETDSQSGTNAMARAVAPLARGGLFFAGHRFTGAHAVSMAAVREGTAAVCCVDCVTLALLTHHQPDAVAGLRCIGYSASAPGLPYVTAMAASPDHVDRLREAVFEALVDPTLSEPREALLINGAELLPAAAYDEITPWPRSVLGPMLEA